MFTTVKTSWPSSYNKYSKEKKKKKLHVWANLINCLHVCVFYFYLFLLSVRLHHVLDDVNYIEIEEKYLRGRRSSVDWWMQREWKLMLGFVLRTKLRLGTRDSGGCDAKRPDCKYLGMQTATRLPVKSSRCRGYVCNIYNTSQCKYAGIQSWVYRYFNATKRDRVGRCTISNWFLNYL